MARNYQYNGKYLVCVCIFASIHILIAASSIIWLVRFFRRPASQPVGVKPHDTDVLLAQVNGKHVLQLHCINVNYTRHVQVPMRVPVSLFYVRVHTYIYMNLCCCIDGIANAGGNIGIGCEFTAVKLIPFWHTWLFVSYSLQIYTCVIVFNIIYCIYVSIYSCVCSPAAVLHI